MRFSRIDGRGAAACGTAVLLAGLAYLNALNNPFVYDDVQTIVGNASLANPTLRAVLLQNVTRPLVNVSYVIDYAFWGPAPFGFHLTSLLLHMANVALLFGFARGIVADRQRPGSPAGPTQPLVAGFAAAALFAVHPMMTEAVGYVSGRSDLLSGTLMLVSLEAVRRWMNTERSRWLAVALAAMFLALAAKETAIILPLLFVYYVLFVRGDAPEARRRHLLMLCVPLLSIAIVGAGARLGLFVFVEYAGRVGWQWRFALTELDVFTRYLALMIVPAGQTIFHAVPATTSFTDPRAVVALVTSAVCLGLIVMAARRRSVAGFGLAWFVLMLVPSALLVLLDRGEPMAERRVYFASAGLFLSAGHVAGILAGTLKSGRPLTRRAVAAAGAIVLCVLAGRTVIRNAVWSSPLLLWAEAEAHQPGHWLPPLVLGETLHADGRHAEAVAAFRRALGPGAHVPAVYEHLGLCLLELRRLGEARETFRTLDGVAPHSASSANGLAMADFLEGDVEAARKGFLAALDVDPRNVEARRGLVLVEESRGGSSAEALRRCREIELLAPGTPGVHECIARHLPAETP